MRKNLKIKQNSKYIYTQQRNVSTIKKRLTLFIKKSTMKNQSMPYEAPELFQISVRVEKGFATSSDIEPGNPGGELGTSSMSYDDYE